MINLVFGASYFLFPKSFPLPSSPLVWPHPPSHWHPISHLAFFTPKDMTALFGLSIFSLGSYFFVHLLLVIIIEIITVIDNVDDDDNRNNDNGSNN